MSKKIVATLRKLGRLRFGGAKGTFTSACPSVRRRVDTFASALPVLVVTGMLGVAGVADASSHVTPLDGQWRGIRLLHTISGSLEGGFTVNTAESMNFSQCSIASGTKVGQFAPIGGGKFSQSFGRLWSDCTQDPVGEPETVTVALSGNTLTISGCRLGYCDTLTSVNPRPTTTQPSTTTQPKKPTSTTQPPKPKPPKKDTSRPVVIAHQKGLTYPGTRDNLLFNVIDDSGQATVSAALFQGGELIGSATWAVVNGIAEWKEVPFANNLIGPIYFCVGAEDAAGNKAKKSCAWIQLLVPIEKVSNGCGGGGWDTLVKIQNYFGNEHSYQESLGTSYTVNFADACNIHDAAYGGHTVGDKINGGPPIDFRLWSRPRIDRKFLGDMRTLCTRSIPASAQNALKKCFSTGGGLSVGALALYNFVDTHGYNFFDANLMLLGTQKRGTRDNF